MTERPVPTSTPLLRTTLVWSAALTGALLLVGGVVGFLVDGTDGLWSAMIAVVLAAAFQALTAVSILIANRWYGDPLYTPIFFGAVMGGWIIKFILFIVVLLVVRDQAWLSDVVFFIALVSSVIGSLVIDAVAMAKMRIPYASDVSLPTADDLPDEGNEGTSRAENTPRD